MLELAQKLLLSLDDLDPNGTAAPWVAFCLTLGVAALAHLVGRGIVLRGVQKLTKRTRWGKALLEKRVFTWLVHLVPALIIHSLTPTSFPEPDSGFVAAIRIACLLYIIVVSLIAAIRFIDAALAVYDSYEVSREIPLKSFAQVLQVILTIIAFIFALSLLLGKSPLVLLGGLGVFASVLMLVFKDSILGLVAGIQLSANQMVHVGDWIEMPQYGADGNILEVALTTVKVQNWDNTITTIPTYGLISGSFKNWRGMSESGGRRIKRSLFIDQSSIRLATADMLQRYAKIEFIADHLTEKEKEIAEWNDSKGVTSESSQVNGRRLTNVGTFRAYIEAYLRHHPEINQELTLLVRQLQPTDRGLPIEIYCFTSDKRWARYEAIQADIFDHLLAVAPEFDLRIFQSPSGKDIRTLASPGASLSADDPRA